MKGNPIHLLIVDDHKLFRRSLSTLIKTFGFPVTFYEAANGKDALEVISANSIDIVLLDMQMPVMNGMETIKRINNLVAKPRVLVLTQFDEKALVNYMLQHGANGFLLKECEPEELRDAIAGIMKDGYFYNAMTLKVIQDTISKIIDLPSLEISSRELQVMMLLKEGKSSKEISKVLGLSLRTIESYRKSLMKKTHCKNVADVVSLAYRTGIVDLSARDSFSSH